MMVPVQPLPTRIRGRQEIRAKGFDSSKTVTKSTHPRPADLSPVIGGRMGRSVLQARTEGSLLISTTGTSPRFGLLKVAEMADMEESQNSRW
jgi:hypothetical protein